MIAVDVGIDEKANRLVRDLPDRRDQPFGERCELCIDEQHAVGACEHADRATLSRATRCFQDVEVISEACGFDLHLAEIGNWSPLKDRGRLLSLNVSGDGQ